MKTSKFGFALLAAFVVSLSACEGCETPPENNYTDPLPTQNQPDGGSGIVVDSDGGSTVDPVVDAGPEPVAEPDSRVLSYTGENPLDVYLNEQPRLTFNVKESNGGAPIANARIRYAFEGTGGTLNVAESRSNSAGDATVVFRAGTTTGAGTLTVTTNGGVAELKVNINVVQNPLGELEIAVSSITRIPLVRSEVVVFLADQGGPAVVSCETLENSTQLPTATFSAPFSQLPATQTYEEINHGSAVTAYALGYDASDRIIGTSCVEGISTIGGQTTEIRLVLSQLPTLVEGNYDVLAQIDLGTALPAPYDEYINTTVAILSDPAGYSAYEALNQMDLNGGFGTDFIGGVNYDDVRLSSTIATNGDCVSSVYTTWCTLRNALDGLMATQLGPRYAETIEVGGDINALVREFEIGNHVSLAKRASTDDIYDVTERWRDLVFTWNRGCPTNDLDCARRPFVIDNTEYTVVQSQTYGAQLVHAAENDVTERFRLNADNHGMSFSYGTVIVIALNELVFPSLPEGVAGRSFEEVLFNLISCADVAASASANTGFSEPTFESVCVQGVSALANFAEGQLLDLQFGSVDPNLDIKGQAGLYSAGNIIFVDENLDLEAELITEYNFVMGWNDPTDPSFTQDITTAITGDGRLAASACSGASQCEVYESCQAIPHYLKVALAEYDCREAIGELAGEESCNQDEDCRSGFCLESQCFLACDNDADCSTNTCGLSVDALDITAVLPGLNSADVNGCKLPSAGLCENTCGENAEWANDGYCDDGGDGADYSVCDLGTDCGDCGPR